MAKSCFELGLIRYLSFIAAMLSFITTTAKLCSSISLGDTKCARRGKLEVKLKQLCILFGTI